MGLFDQAGPTPLGMFANPQQGGGGFLEGFESRMSNPLVAAALGASGGLLGNQGNFAEGLRSGVMGGAGGAFGAMRANRQRKQDEERKAIMRRLLERYGNVADRQASPQGPMFDPFGAVPGVQGGGAFGQQGQQFPPGGLF